MLLGVSLLWIGYAEGSLTIRALGASALTVLLVPLVQRPRHYGGQVDKLRKSCLMALNASAGGYARWAARHRRDLELLFVPASMEVCARFYSRVWLIRCATVDRQDSSTQWSPRRHAIERLAGAIQRRDPLGADREFVDYRP